jgi:hypothetical protein
MVVDLWGRPGRFRGKRWCAFVLRHVTGCGKATPRPRRVTRRRC